MSHSSHLHAFRQRYAQFLAQLACQCSLRSFSIAHFAAGKLPFQRRRVLLPPLSNQQPAIPTLNHRRHNRPHSSCLCPQCPTSVRSVLVPPFLLGESPRTPRLCVIFIFIFVVPVDGE